MEKPGYTSISECLYGCSNKCDICSKDPETCISCTDNINRLLSNQCNCPDGLFDDKTNEACQCIYSSFLLKK